jgi:hypothetical protein
VIQPGDLIVEQAAIGTLSPHPDNPRMSDTDDIAQSLQVHGQYQPIVVSSDNVVLVGNHRYAAAMQLGWNSIGVVRLPYTHDDPHAVKIMLMDNKSSDGGKYDMGLLLNVLQSLDDDLFGTGWDINSVDDIAALLQEQNDIDLDLSNVTGSNPSLGEKYDRYQAVGQRMIVLAYDQDVYPTVANGLNAMRQRYEVDSNAEAVVRMLAEFADIVEAEQS